MKKTIDEFIFVFEFVNFCGKKNRKSGSGIKGRKETWDISPIFPRDAEGLPETPRVKLFFLKRIFTVRNIIAGNGCLLDDIRIQDIRIRYKAEFNYF